MNKAKVLQVHTMSVLYGSGQAVLLMMQGLRAAGYDVALACSAEPGLLPDAAEKQGFKVHRIRNLSRQINPYKDIMAIAELASVLRKEHYAIVHTHNSKAGILGRFAGKVAGTPVILHTIRGFTSLQGRPFWLKPFLYVLKKIVSIWSYKIICISEAVRKWALSLHLTNPDKFEVLYSAIDETRFLKTAGCDAGLMAKFGVEKDDIVICQISKLWHGKGLFTIVDAAKQITKEYDNVKFLLLGDGGLMDELNRKIHEHGLESKVLLPGYVQEIERVMKCIDIGLLISDFEGMGRVLLEYMVSGIPIIAANVGGIPELVKEGENGFLIEPRDTKALISKIRLLLEDRALLEAMGRRSESLFQDKFSFEQMNRGVLRIYEAALKDKCLN